MGSNRSSTSEPSVEVPPDYRFARSPRWLLSHVLVVALATTMIAAGFWQIDRHNSRRERNEQVAARSELEPVPLGSLVPPGSDPSIGEAEEYRRVVVTGVYQVDDEVLVRNRTLDGAPGSWVLTPLLSDEGWAVTVNRGWIPTSFAADAPRPGTEPPLGVVEVTGRVEPARVAEGFQVADPSSGRLSSLGRPDVARLAAQVDYPLLPVVLQLDQASRAAELPVPLPLPPLDAGPHFGYAVQWLIFSTIAVVGYPLVLRRVARGKGGSTPLDDGEYDAGHDLDADVAARGAAHDDDAEVNQGEPPRRRR